MNNPDNEAYSLPEKMRGRKILTLYSVFNSFSFLLLSGNILTLFVLRMDASSSFIGLISSFSYISFFFMVIGRKLIFVFGLIKSYGSAWLLRYLFMLPSLAAPLVYNAGNRSFALGLVLFSALGFHIFRGIGVVAYTPILRNLSEGKDQGRFLSLFQIIAHIISIITGIGVVLLLGESASLSRYLFFLIAGIGMGIVAALMLFRLPVPSNGMAGKTRKLMVSVSLAYRRKNFRRFVWIIAVVSLVIGMVRPFSIVFIKQIYPISDSMAVLYTVIGSVGAIFMGLMSRLLLDRLGAKPLYIIFNILTFLSLIPLVLALPMTGFSLILYLGAAFFLLYLGTAGAENTAQSYLFGLIRPEDQLNLGMFYYLVMGVAGTAGSLFGGVILDFFDTVKLDLETGGFRIFYSLNGLILAGAVFAMSRLERLGAYTFRGALNVIFSLRDLKAINLIQRLDKTTSLGEEWRILKELGQSKSPVSQEEILKRLNSPSYGTRSEALQALETVPLDARAAESVIQHVKMHPFTTSYIAARILGKQLIRKGIPVLREALRSPDYLLAAKSMISLAQLGDAESIRTIEEIMNESDNPLLLIHGVNALAIFGDESSVPVLLDILKREPSHPFLRDEIILSLSRLLGISDWFYPFYSEFLENQRNGISLLEEYLMSSGRTGKSPKKKNRKNDKTAMEIRNLVTGILNRDAAYQQNLADKLKNLSPGSFRGVPGELFLKMAMDDGLMRFDRFAFFLCGVLCYRYVGESG